LRKLSKRFPPPKEVKNIMDALREEGDRSAAIVASSLLESALEKILIAAMRQSDPRLVGQLFENRGPLSDFNGKILIGVAFGAISVQMGEHFQAIRHVRNAFAHSRLPISFETPEVKKEIVGFGMLQAMKEAANARVAKEATDEPLPIIENLPSKQSFLLIVTLLLIILDDLYALQGLGKLYDPTEPDPTLR
jgi:DNA-binding MltR family transcriptional regulator